MKTLALLLTAVVLVLPLHAQAPRQVVVDFQKVFESFRDLQHADEGVKREIQEFRRNQAARIEAMNAKKQRFFQLREQAAAPGIAEEEREALVAQATALFEELRTTEQALQQEQQEFNQQAEAKIGRLRRELADTVSKHISQMAREQGWTLVLDSSAKGANGLPVVHYADPALDVTVDVINSLNASVNREEETESADGNAGEE